MENIFLLIKILIVASTATHGHGQMADDYYCALTRKHTMCLPKGFGPKCGGQALGNGVTKQDIEEILREHNEFRAKVANGKEKRGKPGPQPPAADMEQMEWDDELARVAQKHADQCRFAHDCNKCRRVERFKVGQNLHIFKQTLNSAKTNWRRSITDWYNEVNIFNRRWVKPFKFNAAIGHYSAMLWSNTNKIGCGVTEYKEGRWFSKLYTCDYGPAGNYVNGQMYKVGKACGSCPKGTTCSKKHPGLCAAAKTSSDGIKSASVPLKNVTNDVFEDNSLDGFSLLKNRINPLTLRTKTPRVTKRPSTRRRTRRPLIFRQTTRRPLIFRTTPRTTTTIATTTPRTTTATTTTPRSTTTTTTTTKTPRTTTTRRTPRTTTTNSILTGIKNPFLPLKNATSKVFTDNSIDGFKLSSNQIRPVTLKSTTTGASARPSTRRTTRRPFIFRITTRPKFTTRRTTRRQTTTTMTTTTTTKTTTTKPPTTTTTIATTTKRTTTTGPISVTNPFLPSKNATSNAFKANSVDGSRRSSNQIEPATRKAATARATARASTRRATRRPSTPRRTTRRPLTTPRTTPSTTVIVPESPNSKPLFSCDFEPQSMCPVKLSGTRWSKKTAKSNRFYGTMLKPGEQTEIIFNKLVGPPDNGIACLSFRYKKYSQGPETVPLQALAWPFDGKPGRVYVRKESQNSSKWIKARITFRKINNHFLVLFRVKLPEGSRTSGLDIGIDDVTVTQGKCS